MNVKNILFGLGLGLVCSGAVLLLFRNQGNAELTDAEIKKRAEQLGMVEERQDAILTSELKELEKAENGDALEESPSAEQAGGAESDGNEKADVKEEPAENKIQTGAENVQGTEAEKQEESNADSGKAQAEEKKSTASEKTKKSDKKNTASSASSKKKKKNTKTEEKQEDDDKKELETITVEIKSGMTAGAICEAFQKQGIIENAEDFRNYLVQKKIQHKLRAGTFEFSKGADYEEIIGEIYKG